MVTARITAPVAYELMEANTLTRRMKVTYSEDFIVNTIEDGVVLLKQRVGGTTSRPLHNYFIQDAGDGSRANAIVRALCKSQKTCIRFIPVAL